LKIIIKKRGLKTRLTASVLPAMILASLAVASDWIAETSTPSRLTFVEMFKAGIFSIKKNTKSLYLFVVMAANQSNTSLCFLLLSWFCYSVSTIYIEVHGHTLFGQRGRLAEILLAPKRGSRLQFFLQLFQDGRHWGLRECSREQLWFLFNIMSRLSLFLIYAHLTSFSFLFNFLFFDKSFYVR